MKLLQHILIGLMLVTLLPARVWAQSTTNDSTEPPKPQISLLTCGAGQAIHTLFGHSAIRVKDAPPGSDIVFNYGIFSFKTPHFAWRFALGQTDYQLGAQYFSDFMTDYVYANRQVTESVLNLTPEQSDVLLTLLNENYQPRNRFYRYNYFYDNCATRPRDLIERVLGKKLAYCENVNEPDRAESSFRDFVHAYTTQQPWEQFGIDLCLGPEADEPISKHMSMFIPFYLERYVNCASIDNGTGETTPLVSEQNVLFEGNTDEQSATDTFFTPFLAFSILLLLTIAITAYGLLRHRSLWIYDILLFGSAGVAGCILTFLCLFSEHPAVSPNYLLLVFHPLHLLIAPWFIRKTKRQERSWYLTLNTLIIGLFLLTWPILPQVFNLTVLPLALCLLVRSVSNILMPILSKR